MQRMRMLPIPKGDDVFYISVNIGKVLYDQLAEAKEKYGVDHSKLIRYLLLSGLMRLQSIDEIEIEDEVESETLPRV